MSKVYQCDRCGKIFKFKVIKKYPYYDIIKKDREQLIASSGEIYCPLKTIDLCVNCREQLESWLNIKNV